MSFICMRMKNNFHIKGCAPTLVLKQRPGGTRKWPIRLYILAFAVERKQPTFRDATNGFPAKWRLRDERKNIPYWWRVTTQTWVVFLISWRKFHKRYYPDLGSDASSVWNFWARFSDVISWGNRWWRPEMSFVFLGYLRGHAVCTLRSLSIMGGIQNLIICDKMAWSEHRDRGVNIR